jgi:hypothetical protein
MKLATGDAALAIKLHEHVNFYVPKGWSGPIHEFDFAPMFTVFEASELRVAFERGTFTEYLDTHYKKFYVKEAVREFFNKEKI